MNYDKARELLDHTWNYSRQHDEDIYPIGYCSKILNDNNESHRHKTCEEAEECYKQYELDNNLILDGGKLGDKKKCQVEGCTNHTNISSHIGAFDWFILCDEHRNRKTVETIFSVRGEFIHS